MNAKFIVIEGLEGAGKTTQIDAVVRWLQQNLGVAVITTREPGGTAIAEQLRQIIKHGVDAEQLTPMGEVLLLYAARLQLVEKVIRPALAAGTWVVGDRHDMSTLAYQGGGRMLDLTQLMAVRQLTLGDFIPDLTLYLDIDPVFGMQRARQRGELDRIEQEAIDFFCRIRCAYQQLVAEDPKAYCIDAAGSPDEVSQRLIQRLEQVFC